MCNLYSLTKGQAAIRDLFKVEVDRASNLPTLSGIFPNYAARIFHVVAGKRTLSMCRWGMPSPAFALKGKKMDPGATYTGLLQRLDAHGFKETEASITMKLKRGTFAATFLFACLAALELEGVQLAELT